MNLSVKQIIIAGIVIIFILSVLYFFNIDISKKLPWSGLILCVVVIIAGIIKKYK